MPGLRQMPVKLWNGTSGGRATSTCVGGLTSKDGSDDQGQQRLNSDVVEQNFHHLLTPPIRNIQPIQPALKHEVRQLIFSTVNFHFLNKNRWESSRNVL